MYLSSAGYKQHYIRNILLQLQRKCNTNTSLTPLSIIQDKVLILARLQTIFPTFNPPRCFQNQFKGVMRITRSMVDEMEAVQQQEFGRKYKVDWGSILTSNISLLVFGARRLADNVESLNQVCNCLFQKEVPKSIFKNRNSQMMTTPPKLAERRMQDLMDVFSKSVLYRMISSNPEVMVCTVQRVQAVATVINRMLPNVNVEQLLTKSPRLLQNKPKRLQYNIANFLVMFEGIDTKYVSEMLQS